MKRRRGKGSNQYQDKPPTPPRAPRAHLRLVTSTEEVVHKDEITLCDYPWVREGNAYRRCQNAILVPARRCHLHGGGLSTSLGLDLRQAMMGAEAGTLARPNRASWLAAKRVEVLDHDLMRLVREHPQVLAQTWDARHESLRGTRWAYAVMSYWRAANEADLDGQAMIQYVREMVAQPHMSANAWALRNVHVGQEPGVEVPRAVAVEPVVRATGTDEVRFLASMASVPLRREVAVLYREGTTAPVPPPQRSGAFQAHEYHLMGHMALGHKGPCTSLVPPQENEAWLFASLVTQSVTGPLDDLDHAGVRRVCLAMERYRSGQIGVDQPPA